MIRSFRNHETEQLFRSGQSRAFQACERQAFQKSRMLDASSRLSDLGVLPGNRLARDLRVPPTRISEIVNQRRGISSDTALRLSRYFGTTAEFWMNLQSAYDLDVARGAMPQIERDVQPIVAA